MFRSHNRILQQKGIFMYTILDYVYKNKIPYLVAIDVISIRGVNKHPNPNCK